MRSQLTVRVPDDMDREISRIAKSLNLRRSDIVRMALDRFIRGGRAAGETTPYEKVQMLLGKVTTGIPDLGENHRAHLLRKIAPR